MSPFLTNLDVEYGKLIGQPDVHVKAQVLYSIIQIKSENIDLYNYTQSLYLDIKQFIEAMLDSTKQQGFGYDEINFQTFFTLFDIVPTKEGIALNNFLLRLLKIKGYEEEIEMVKQKHQALELTYCKNNSTVEYYYKLILYHSAKSQFSLTLSIFFLLIIYSILLLPVPSEKIPAFFSITYDEYTSYFIVNHFINLLAAIFDVGQTFEIKPLNLGGVLLMITGKIVFIVIIGNFLISELLKKISD